MSSSSWLTTSQTRLRTPTISTVWDAQNPGKEPFNFYRYTGKRFDPSSGGYDMGFRDYQPAINRFTVRDTYNGALDDLNLGTNPWTGNRYTMAGGNPITGIELDGHILYLGDGSASVTRSGASASAINAAQQRFTANPAGTSVQPLRPPNVQNDDLRDILKEGYLRPGEASWVGDGTTADALRYELQTGNGTGKGQEKYHSQKAMNQFRSLAGWLDNVRANKIKPSQGDIRVARIAIENLWDALTTDDATGKVIADIKSHEAAGDHTFRNAYRNASQKAAVSYLTGAEFEYDKRGKPTQRISAKWVAPGITGLGFLAFGLDAANRGLPDAVLDQFDVTGTGRQTLEQREMLEQCYQPGGDCVA